MDNNDFNMAAKDGPAASDYLGMLEDEHDMTEEQKLEMLEALFSIMKSFVLMGYGMEPVDKLVAAFLEADESDRSLIDSKTKTLENDKEA